MRRRAYAVALVFALSIAYDLTRIPVQVSDSLDEILDAAEFPSIASAFVSGLQHRVRLRPLRVAQTKALFDLSHGHYTVAYRGFHVLVLVVFMFVRTLQIETATDLAAAVFALGVLIGLHTFSGLIREGFPVNHYLEITLFTLIALNLAQARSGWMVDAAAALTFMVAALTLESGLLVWVVLVAAWLSGMRGVSRVGLAIVSMLLGGYLYLRFVLLAQGLAPVDEQNAAYLLQTLDPETLRTWFGDKPLPFYALNVFASVVSVLFSEPRTGLWVATGEYLSGELTPRTAAALFSSFLTTIIIVIAAAEAWRNRSTGHEADRCFFIFGAVLVANAALSFSYTKDEIVSAAGAFYALAAYAAVRRLLAITKPAWTPASVALGIALAVASAGWVVRAEGLHYAVRMTAFKTRNDWAIAPRRENSTEMQRDVADRLRRDALERRVVAPRFIPAWQSKWFDEY
ncbi:MAG: hypothetical protein HYX77_02305 [Acidobacteria bacterium]|nr:hypothetical protein [Acidobacteriota bacterium]